MNPRVVSRILFTFLLLTTLISARADLILANYSATNLMKIMPVGDSITDDCVISGAWRLPLQPLLETNGIWYTNKGRLLTPATSGFTKRMHEGYCGTVVGPPGVFAVYFYSTTDAYLHRIIRDALAITNNRPDLMLVLIGANDIGRGRNPRVVATNDMPILLNHIFSNAPNAHVILSKATTLLNASLNYNFYATNVPIYNAYLQAMVNQHRASGQKVYLADMFSAVDYSTGFQSDHLHPNALGLKAIAAEWLTRIQSISVHTNQFTSAWINGGANWKYADSGQDLGTNWAQPDFDDSAWSNGIARLGYGDLATATTVKFGTNVNDKFITTYFRRPFTVPWNAIVTNLNFRVARADGAVVWLNGQEIFRANLPDGPISFTNNALGTMTNFTGHIFYPTNLSVTNLSPGTNLVAVEIHISSPTNRTMGFNMELIGSGYLLPTPSLAIMQTGNSVQLSWPLTNGTSFSLYSTTNPAATGSWAMVSSTLSTNSGQLVVTQMPDISAKYFRLQRP